MGCVNKSSREFKDTAARNGVSDNTLELIVHKYWMTTGNEESFPSDLYIQAQLGNTMYQEPIKEVREVWNLDYSTPRTYDTVDEVQLAVREALKYFPLNAVMYYRNAEGGFTLSVRRPVEKTSKTVGDFFSQDFSSAKTLDLNLEKNKEYGIDKVEELFNKFNTDRTSKFLANRVFDIAKNLGIKVFFNDELPFGKIGSTINNGTITYKKSFLERDINNDKKAPLLLHEAIHALTMYALSDSTKNWNRSTDLEIFRTNINQIFNEIKYNKTLKGERGILNVNEFVAELSNPIFRQKLQNIDTGKKKSLWSRIIDAIKNFLGIEPSSTYYQRSMNALEKALNAFDIDSWLVYNGMKQPLQQAYNDHRVDFENMTEGELKSMLKNSIKNNAIKKENSRLYNIDNKIKEDGQDKINKGIQAGGETFGHLYRLLHDSRRSNQENQGETSNGKSLRERSYEGAVRQQQLVTDWAKKNNKLIIEPNDYYNEKYNNQSVTGSESKVWYNNDKKVAVKNISTNHYDNIQRLLERIAIHNAAFPNTAMEVTGIGSSDNGISVVIEQPWVNSINGIPTLREIENYMTSQGFVHIEGTGINAVYAKDGYLITDVRPENVIKQPNGELVVINCFAIFNENTQINYAENNLSSFIDSMSKEQLVDELKKIRQEYADYDLVNDDSDNSEDKKEGESTFTFSDGVTVKTPFALNNQQVEALNIMNDFINSDDETTMTLSGYAGTGKTSLLRIIADKVKYPWRMAFSATTNKATAVLKSKVPSGFKVMTVNQMFGINMEINQNNRYNMSDLVVRLRKDLPIDPGIVVVIDEASMINEANYRTLNEIARENALKIIYVGDRGQLAPVGDDKISPVFRNANGKVVELTKVERTNDNAILKEATNIRNGRPLSMESSFNKEDKGVAYVNPKGEHRQYIIDTINHFIPGLKNDSDYFKVLAYTNKAVSQYNEYIRELLGYDDNIPREGEMLVGYANWGRYYDRAQKKSVYKFVNSETYKVIHVGSPERSSVEARNVYVTMEVVPVTLTDSLGNRITVKLVDVKGNPANKAAAAKFAQVKTAIHDELRRARTKKEKALLLQEENDIDRNLFINDDIYATDENGNVIMDRNNKPILLQRKVFDFGYAITIHKSQGSTYNNVLIDENDIAKASENTVGDSELVEIDLDSGEITPVNTRSDFANMKQQLEYVAISRASDTATIITDKAKKEDSVLNHLGDKKTTETQQKEQQETQPQEDKSATPKFGWSRYSNIGYEVSSDGDDRFSALKATFNDGTIWDGRKVGGKTIEWVYQTIVKKSGKGQPPAKDSVLYNENLKTKEEREDYSYEKGYLPLWRLWAEQHPKEMDDLRAKAQGRVLTDKFATTRVSQARALADILNDNVPNGSQSIAQQLVEHLRGIRDGHVHGREEMMEYLKQHNLKDEYDIRMAMSKRHPMYITDSLTNEEKRAIRNEVYKINNAGRSLIETEYGLYVVDHSDREGIDDRHENQEGFQCLAVIPAEKLSRKQINNLKNKIENGHIRSTGDVDSWFKKYTDQQGHHFSDNVNATVRGATTDNAGLDSETSQGESGRGFGDRNSQTDNEGRQVKTGWDGVNHPRYMDAVGEREDGLARFTTPEGEIYGFVTKEGEIYLDETTISPEHPLHEYTHLWDSVVEKKNPDLWRRGVELMKEFDGGRMWKEYSDHEHYGKRWKAAGFSDSQIESLIASEIHARLVGQYGEKLLDTIAKEKGQSGIVAKLKEWIIEFWQNLKATFSKWLPDEIKKLTISDFNHMTVRDFADGINFDTAPTFESVIQAQGTQKSHEQSMSEKQHERITVKLPEYEAFKNLDKSVIVERWKEERLKDLEENLRDADTSQAKQEIADKIDDVLKAATSDELGEYSSKRKARIQKRLDNYKKINEQVRNLFDGKLVLHDFDGTTYMSDVKFSASEINKVSEYVANYMSDMITDIQTGKADVKDLFPDLSFADDIDFSSMSRIGIVNTIGINNIVYKVKNDFAPESEVIPYEDGETMRKAFLMLENWDATMLNTSKFLSLTEGFGISMDYDEGRLKMADADLQVDPENVGEYQDEATIEETQGDAQEHWQVESDTLGAISLMTNLVKQTLRNMYQLDSEGKVMIDPDWMLPMRMPLDKSTKNILNWVQGAMSMQEMIDKIKEKEPTNPWVSQLLKLLEDKSGQYSDFQSQFYGTFSKTYKLYSVTSKDKDGIYTSMPVNSRPALKEVMNGIIARYHMNEYPLISSQGKINIEYLGSEDTADSEEFTLYKASQKMTELKNKVENRLKHKNKFVQRDMRDYSLESEEVEEAVKWLTGAYRILGYFVDEDTVRNSLDSEKLSLLANKLSYTVEDLTTAYERQMENEGNPKAKPYEPFSFKSKNNISGELSAMLEVVMGEAEANTDNVVYDSGKLYQSYVIPSFMTRLVQNLTRPSEERRIFIDKEYGRSEWFITEEGGWRNKMLSNLYSGYADGVFDFKTELNFNKHNYMRNMSPSEYALSLFTNYFANGWKTKNEDTSWYRMPMPSNKPASEFFRWYSYREYDYKEHITGDLYNIFLQELSRIQTVRMRNLSKGEKGFIDNFDTNGRNFCFLPFLNSYLENTEEAKRNRTLLKNEDGTISEANNRMAELIQNKVKGTEEDKLSSEEEVELANLVKKTIHNYLETRANQILDSWDKSGLLEAARKVKNIVFDNELIDDDDHSENRNRWIRVSLENFIWNDYLANKNILQLVVGDLAFAKNTDDLIKRLSGFHAPGIRGNKDATDYQGNKVSDGSHRTVILKDWDDFISNIIDNIAEVYDRKIERAKDHEKEALKAIKEDLVGENGKYRNINVADAQGLMSPSSMRKKAFIFGKMTTEAEDAFKNYKRGKYRPDSLSKPFQIQKPFAYTHVMKNMNVEDAPISMMYVPFMAKNSEYMLVMADALIREEELVNGKMSRPNLLRAVFRVMEESYDADPAKGIDTIQFESAIKLGKQGAIDLHQFADMEGGEEAAYTYLKEHIYLKNEDGTYSNEYDTDNYVQEYSYDDYAIQQEVPAHFKDHSQIQASQERVNVIADLDYYKDPYGNLEDPDNIVRYEWTEPDGKKESMTATELQNAYENTIADNIQEDIDKLYAEFHLTDDKKERNMALSQALQNEIMSSPRYGMDLFIACSVDENTGEFRMPKGDPIQAKRIEQLVNSIIKNRINKQEIAGGPIVQVTNYGTSKRLNIRFKDKDGNVLMTKDEFEKTKNNGEDTGFDTYKEYIKNRQDGIAYFEVYAPIWNDKLIEYFADENGNIDMEAVERCDPELLKIITYRIPNEDKYSVAPCKIVGFMPREAGDAIMLPYDLTTIDDSDFDVDKRYTIRKQLHIVRKPRKQLHDMLYKNLEKSYKESHGNEMNYATKKKLNEQIDMFLDNPERMAKSDDLMGYMSVLMRKNGYTVEKPTEGRLYRDNRIVDMTWAALTNGVTADKLLNPGGFDEIKKLGYLIDAYKNPLNKDKTWNELSEKSTDELKKMNTSNKDLGFPDVQIQYYRQNSATSGLIGVFAVNKSAHAILERDKYLVDVEEACGEGFKLAGREYTGKMIVDDTKDTDGKYIGKTLGSGVSASADGVKEPVLTLMNIYMTTAGLFNVMLRLGIPLRTATLLMSQNVMTRAMEYYEKSNLSNYVTLNSVINEYMESYMRKNNISRNDAIFHEDITDENLIEGLREGDHGSHDFKVMNVINKLLQLNTPIRRLTYATRFNSISSAVGPLIVHNLIQKYKMSQFTLPDGEGETGVYDKNGNPVDLYTVFKAHPILDKFSQGIGASGLFFGDMPAGSKKFEDVTNSIKGNLKDRIMTDERLLGDLSNFYQTYVLVASGLADPSELKYYIEDFPTEFVKDDYKGKYADNALIQAINPNVNKNTKRTFLSINTTGMQNLKIERLKNAWEDLHKSDPELSEKLFWYNYFRGGVGFSPKTFMSLVPTYVKEHLSRTLPGGSTVTYVDSYRTLPDADPETIFNQFVRNNWDNNKLVPWVQAKKRGFMFDYEKGVLKITDLESVRRLSDTPYIKTKGRKKNILWEKETSTKTELVFNIVEPLGNNGEYVEMYKAEKKKSLNEADKAEATEAEKEMKTPDTDGVIDEMNDNGEYKLSNLLWLMEMQNPRLTGEKGKTKYDDMKNAPERYKGFLANVFKKKGINVNEEDAIKEFKKYC